MNVDSLINPTSDWDDGSLPEVDAFDWLVLTSAIDRSLGLSSNVANSRGQLLVGRDCRVRRGGRVAGRQVQPGWLSRPLSSPRS